MSCVEPAKAFEMHHATMIVTRACNLNCKRCGVLSPYYTNPAFYPAEDLCETAERFFRIASHVRKLGISGGEPLLYPYLAEVLERLKSYEARIDILEIVTNGTIVPKPEVLRQFRQWGGKISVLVDDYGAALSKKVSELDAALTQANVRHIIRNNSGAGAHCGGWVDFGDYTTRNARTPEETRLLYGKCAYPQKMRFCFAIDEGFMYPCAAVELCRKLGSVDHYDDYIDLFDESLSVEEQRRKIRAIYDATALSACAYCNGLCDDSERFVPAEQLALEEIRFIRNYNGTICPPQAVSQYGKETPCE